MAENFMRTAKNVALRKSNNNNPKPSCNAKHGYTLTHTRTHAKRQADICTLHDYYISVYSLFTANTNSFMCLTMLTKQPRLIGA